MTLPSADKADGSGSYACTPDKTVSVGDPTKAAADHNTLAENDDWLKRIKPDFVDGGSQTVTDVPLNCGGGFVDIADAELTIENDLVLIDVSGIDLPQEDDRLLHRFIHVDFILLMKSADSEDSLPGEENDTDWNGASGSSGRLKGSVHFYAGPGQNAHDADSYVVSSTATGVPATEVYVKFWVDDTDKDLMVRIVQNPNTFSEAAIHAQIRYGVNWQTP